MPDDRITKHTYSASKKNRQDKTGIKTASKALLRVHRYKRGVIFPWRIPKRPHRHIPGSISALRKILSNHEPTDLLIPKTPWTRPAEEDLITQDVLAKLRSSYQTTQASALEAIQDGCKAYIARLLENAILLANHDKRITVQAKDVQLARRLQG